MGPASKRQKKRGHKCSDVESSDYEDQYGDEMPMMLEMDGEDGVSGDCSMISDDDDGGNDYGNSDESDQEELEEGENEDYGKMLGEYGERSEYDDDDDDDNEERNVGRQDEELEELEKEYRELKNSEENLVVNLMRHKDEDILKGRAVKNQKALWDKDLECRFLLQKSFSNSNRLPQEPIQSSFYEADEGVKESYSDVIDASKKAIGSILELQEALMENNASITQVTEGGSGLSTHDSRTSNKLDVGSDEEWSRISHMHSRMDPFRNKYVDKWKRKTEANTGGAAKRSKLHAFNQDISVQVALYMRDPSKMIRGMQMPKETVHVFGAVDEPGSNTNEEDAKADDDPQLLSDSELYQQLLKEFFETVDPSSSEAAFYALKRVQAKKRKVVDRRASKSRKIRYNVHEKLVNFMAPQPMDLPPMAPKLFANLFGLKSQKSVSVA